MGNNCCSQASEKTDINTKKKLAPRSKHGATTNGAEHEDLLFSNEAVVAQDIDGSLYSDFDTKTNQTLDDTDEETDWETYEKDVTFERKGNAINMFKEHILEEAIKHASEELQRVFKVYGPLKVKPKDIPEELNVNEVEFRQEGYK